MARAMITGPSQMAHCRNDDLCFASIPRSYPGGRREESDLGLTERASVSDNRCVRLSGAQTAQIDRIGA